MNGRQVHPVFVIFARKIVTWVLIGTLLACLAETVEATTFSLQTLQKSGARVYLNPNTGRFWSMDSFEGNNEDPISLHKYLYCYANPVDFADRSGHDGDLMSLSIVNAISAAINSMSFIADMRAHNYSAAVVDLVGVGLSFVGGGGIGPGSIKTFATVDGVYLTSAQLAVRAKILRYLATALGAGIAGNNITLMASSGSSNGGGTSSASGSSSSSSTGSNPEDDVINETMNGTGDFTSRHTLTTTQVLNAATKWLGSDVKQLDQSGSVFYNPKTGHRFRIDNGSIRGLHSAGPSRGRVPHVSFERIDPNTGKVLANNHVPFTE